MAATWELVPDLIGLAVFAFLYALLWLLTSLLVVAFGAVDSVLGWIPGFGSLERSLGTKVHNVCESLLTGVKKGMVWTLNGIVDSFALIFGVIVLFAEAVWIVLTTLEKVVVAPAIKVALDPLHDLIGTVPRPYKSVTAWASAELAAGSHALHDLVGAIPRPFTDVAAWVDNVEKGAAHDLKQFDKKVVQPIEHELALTIRPELQQLGADAAVVESAIAAGAAEATAVLPHLPELTWDELQKVMENKDLQKLAGLLAAIPLAHALIGALTTEAGLSNAQCRSNVKQICGTNPAHWANLLLGLAALGFAFDLGEVAHVASTVVGEAGGLLAEVGNVSQETIDKTGHAIGSVVAAIAA